jgi:uncharacterized protein YggE
MDMKNKSVTFNTITGTLLAALTLVFCAVTQASSHPHEPTPQVSVSAVGEVDAIPDIAIIHGQVITIAKTAEQALNEAQIQRGSVIKFVLTGLGVKKEDLQAAQVLVAPEWNYPRNKPRELKGYKAQAKFTVKLRDLDVLSTLYSGLAKAGVNDLRPASFDFSNRDELELEAISAAVEKAKKKAKAALSPLGDKVGKAVSVNVNTHWQRPPVLHARMAMSAEADASKASVNVGNHTITANVNVSFTIK